MVVAAAGLVLSMTLALGAPASEGAASSAVHEFYAAYSKVHRPGGLPTAEELKQL